MSRVLAHGRNTKQDPGESFRQNGLITALGNKGLFGDYLDQLLFEAHGYEYILGSASQLSAKYATITWDQAQQRFEDNAGSEVVLDDYDRIAVIGMDTLTANMVIDNVVGLEIFHIGNTAGQTGDDPKFKLGVNAADENAPFKIMLGPNTSGCKLDLMTDKDFKDLTTYTYGDSPFNAYKARYVANQGINNYIKANGYECYNPSEAGKIVKFDSYPINPYFVRMNGQVFPYAANAVVNNLAWFRDLNIALDGYQFNGTSYDETISRFTVAASAYLSQVNSSYRFLTDISGDDANLHSRADSASISIAATADFVNTSNVVTFQGGLGAIKNNMRINGGDSQGIPDATSSPPGTTILRNVNSNTGTAEMYDAITGSEVPANTTTTGISVTLDNSGAAGGSRDEDYFQNITGEFEILDSDDAGNPILSDAAGALSLSAGGSDARYIDIITGTFNRQQVDFDASNSPNAKIHPNATVADQQIQPMSTGVYYYYKV